MVWNLTSIKPKPGLGLHVGQAVVAGSADVVWDKEFLCCPPQVSCKQLQLLTFFTLNGLLKMKLYILASQFINITSLSCTW